jgi:hypothetical protein
MLFMIELEKVTEKKDCQKGKRERTRTHYNELNRYDVHIPSLRRGITVVTSNSEDRKRGRNTENDNLG